MDVISMSVTDRWYYLFDDPVRSEQLPISSLTVVAAASTAAAAADAVAACGGWSAGVVCDRCGIIVVVCCSAVIVYRALLTRRLQPLQGRLKLLRPLCHRCPLSTQGVPSVGEKTVPTSAFSSQLTSNNDNNNHHAAIVIHVAPFR